MSISDRPEPITILVSHPSFHVDVKLVHAAAVCDCFSDEYIILHFTLLLRLLNTKLYFPISKINVDQEYGATKEVCGHCMVQKPRQEALCFSFGGCLNPTCFG